MERAKFRLVTPIYLDGRYGMHELLPITDPWKEDTNYHFLIQESYYRVIYKDDKSIEALDLDGGPFMSIGTVITDKLAYASYKIEKFDCRGLYPVIICSKLQS